MHGYDISEINIKSKITRYWYMGAGCINIDAGILHIPQKWSFTKPWQVRSVNDQQRQAWRATSHKGTPHGFYIINHY